jgi:hypothetical protein
MTDTNRDPLPPSNLKAQLPSKSLSSWGAAFQSAAEVKPHDLGDFQPPVDDPNKPKYGAGNLSVVGALAQESLQKQKPDLKRKAPDSENDSDDRKKAKKSKKKSKKEKKSKKDKKSKKEKKNKSSDGPQKEASTALDVADTKDSQSDAIEAAPSPTLEGQMVTHRGESLLVLVDHTNEIVYSMDRSESGDLIPIGTVVSGEIKIKGMLCLHVNTRLRSFCKHVRSRCSYLSMVCVGQ